ncbi:MAG: 16S rRNA (uracil(1498)-N(3))-methyltransferase [Bacteroidia bacterium]
MQLFYCPNINSDLHFFSEEEAEHCIGVLRHKKGDVVHLVDGEGGLYKAEIIIAEKKNCEVRILETQKETGRRNYSLHIAIAPTKNIDRLEFFLEKTTEIGIDEITPIICEHSERKEIKRERLNKILVAAMKQSVKAYLPELNSSIRFKDFVEQAKSPQKFICTCEVDKSSTLKNIYSKENDVLLLIGPEGDFSKEEIKFAESNGFKTISLGESRLRTETAGIVACSTIYFINQ